MLDARSTLLAGAVARAQELLDGRELIEGWSLTLRLGLASSGYLVGSEERVRMADLAALSAFRVGLPHLLRLKSEPSWRAFVFEHLQPVARLVLEEAIASGMIEPAAAARLSDRLASLIRDYYSDERAGDPWAHVELVGRLARCQTLLAAVPNHRDGLDAMRDRLREVTHHRQQESAEVLAAWAAYRADGLKPGGLPMASRFEAVAEALADPGSRALTFALTADGYLEDHWRAVAEQAGEPVRLDVVVASDDRWLQALTPDRTRVNGVWVRGHCILLSRSVGEEAHAQHRVPRLNHTLVHEIVHASQRERLLPPRPPFDIPAWRVERALLEGATEFHTRRVMGRARTRWSGSGKNPYSAKDWERSAYVGFVGLCAGIQKVIAPDDSDGFWVRLSHSPHRMTYITEGLTGREDHVAREAVIAELHPLVQQAWRRHAMAGLTEKALRAFQERPSEIPFPTSVV